MRRVATCIAAATILGGGAAGGQDAPVPETRSARCGVGIPRSEDTGYIGLPRGDVFCPLLADPKANRSFATYFRARSGITGTGGRRALDTDVASVGIGDSFGLGRWNGAQPNDGVQFSLSASVFAQFDLSSSSDDLLNADYVIGLPVTFRRGGFSGRARIYHQSSHLGDEFLLRPEDPQVQRENLSFEAAELILSRDLGMLRAYAGGEYLFRRVPEDLEQLVAHAGAELRPGRPIFSVGPIANIRFVAAVDVKSSREQDWRPATSALAGFEIARRNEPISPGRRWSLVTQYYSGPSPYGQFYRDDIRYYGFGVMFTP